MDKVLLVIDDEEEFGAMMQRALGAHFDAIHVATRSADALWLLNSEPITHVVCDLYLGVDEPLGHELVRGWRELKPTIRFMAIFTGSSVARPKVDGGVDGVFKKPAELVDLFRILKSDAA